MKKLTIKEFKEMIQDSNSWNYEVTAIKSSTSKHLTDCDSLSVSGTVNYSSKLDDLKIKFNFLFDFGKVIYKDIFNFETYNFILVNSNGGKLERGLLENGLSDIFLNRDCFLFPVKELNKMKQLTKKELNTMMQDRDAWRIKSKAPTNF